MADDARWVGLQRCIPKVYVHTTQALIRTFPTHFADDEILISVTVDIASRSDIGAEKTVEGVTGFNPHWI